MNRSAKGFQWLIIAVLQALGLFLLSQLNQSLATVSLFFFMNGLFIAFPALYLPIGQGLATVVVFSIFYDAGESWSIGTSLLPAMIAFTILYYLRNKIHLERNRVLKPVILLTNAVLYFFYTIIAGFRFGFTSPFIFLNLLHLMVSQLILQAFTSWLITYHKQILLMFRVDVDSAIRAAK